MATNKDLLTITTPTFERVISVKRDVYTHYVKSSGKKDDDLIASVSYPGSGNMVARRSQSGYVCIQHSSFHPRAPKRTLLSLNVDRDEDRFFEDGTIIRAGTKAKEDTTPVIRIKTRRRDDGSSIVSTTFTSIIPATTSNIPAASTSATNVVGTDEPDENGSDNEVVEEGGEPAQQD